MSWYKVYIYPLWEISGTRKMWDIWLIGSWGTWDITITVSSRYSVDFFSIYLAHFWNLPTPNAGCQWLKKSVVWNLLLTKMSCDPGDWLLWGGGGVVDLLYRAFLHPTLPKTNSQIPWKVEVGRWFLSFLGSKRPVLRTFAIDFGECALALLISPPGFVHQITINSELLDIFVWENSWGDDTHV